MRTIVLGCCFALVACAAIAESPEPPLDNVKFSVHTLLREDIFAGWMEGDMERFTRGEKNIDKLLEQRPRARAELLSWKGGATLYRAVMAREAGDNESFKRLFDQSLEYMAEAKKLAPLHPAVAAIVGGSYLTFADRLPEEHRAAAWDACYENYHVMWKQQSRLVERLPVHIRGELLAGLAQSAERTGRREELAEHLDKIIAVLPDTDYQRVAQQWKDNPESAKTVGLSCKTCHEPGTLSARLANSE